MKKMKYEIQMDSGEKKTVEGYVFNEIWGVDKREPGYYVITYIPNGCRAWSAKTLRECKALLAEPEFFLENDDFRVLIPAIVRHEQRWWDEQLKKRDEKAQKKGGQI